MFHFYFLTMALECAGKIIIFLLPNMFYKTFVVKYTIPLVYLFLNYFLMDLNF
jgi:hypothetical protein